MKLKTQLKTINDKNEIIEFLAKYSIYADSWQSEKVHSNLTDPLLVYKKQIEKLKTRFNYASADVCAMTKDTFNLDTMLSAFIKEHHHTDDEVRFVVSGEGIFGINPLTELSFEIYVEAGDLLLVPAYTQHWFNLTDKKNICCIRVFKENPKWEAIYELPKRNIEVH